MLPLGMYFVNSILSHSWFSVCWL
uniref:Uncharacterized protein n=1 Tax=Rhizophora mucronata TaxID=61149 RepID=A0A2P2QX03_RHIMU